MGEVGSTSIGGGVSSSDGIRVPRILICGTHRGVGVSTILFGLVVSYIRNQLGIGTAYLGSSLIEPTHYRRLANRLSYTISPQVLDREELLSSLKRLSDGTELALLEGFGGLFDNYGTPSSFLSNADFAVATKTPVILVVDGHGYGESIAAQISGFQEFRPEVKISGVIVNRVPAKGLGEKLRAAVEKHCRLQFLGTVRHGDPHQMGATLASYRAHNPSALTRNRVIGTGNLIREAVDLEALKAIGNTAEPLVQKISAPVFLPRKGRIAVADDQAFHLTVQDNLDLLRRAGVELVPFSPIADLALPKNCQAVYFPGGYPHLYAPDLQANQSIRRAIRTYIDNGGAFYAEAGALAYLAKRLTTFQGSSYDMVGAFPASATAVIADDIQQPYPIYELRSNSGNLLGKNYRIRGLRQTRWSFRLESKLPSTLERERILSGGDEGKVGGELPEGIALHPNVLLTQCYLHWASCPEVATNLIERVSDVKAPSPSR